MGMGHSFFGSIISNAWSAADATVHTISDSYTLIVGSRPVKALTERPSIKSAIEHATFAVSITFHGPLGALGGQITAGCIATLANAPEQIGQNVTAIGFFMGASAGVASAFKPASAKILRQAVAGEVGAGLALEFGSSQAPRIIAATILAAGALTPVVMDYIKRRRTPALNIG